MRTILQVESNECGLTCLAMIAGHYGYVIEPRDMRRMFQVSANGTTLSQIINFSSSLGLATRPVRLEMHEAHYLHLPCILHWDLNHFVVLKKIRSSPIRKRQFIIVDPAFGERRLTAKQFSASFTGVALEVSPAPNFEKRNVSVAVPVTQLTGPIKGLGSAIAQAVFLAGVLEIFALVAPLLNQFIIDDVVVGADKRLLAVLTIGFGLLLVTQSLISIGRSWFLMRWGIDISFQWSVRVLSHLIRLPAAYFEKRQLGDVLSRFSSMSAIQSSLTNIFVESVLDGLMSLISLCMMILYSVKLTFIVVVGFFLYISLRACFYSSFREASRERLNLSARESSNFLETLRAITPIKLFGHESRRVARWQNLKTDVINRDIKTQKLSLVFKSANVFISGTQNLMLLYFGASLVIERNLTIGMLTAFTSYASTFASRAFSLADAFVDLKMLNMHTERLSDIVMEPAEQASEPYPHVDSIDTSITLKGVSFRYGEAESWVIKDVSLHIAAGESIAFVGPSGSGKSTLCKIILGLLVPCTGEILLGGIPISRIGNSSYRSLIGTVMQDDVLLNGSIRDNICFFDERPDEAAIIHCASLASIHQEIVSMPMGYQTLVGDMGSTLSGGQKQRILLARALYKRPRILALDEATSHLDQNNELNVNNSIRDLKITRIFVAHRAETIAAANRVFMIDKTSVSEVEESAK